MIDNAVAAAADFIRCPFADRMSSWFDKRRQDNLEETAHPPAPDQRGGIGDDDHAGRGDELQRHQPCWLEGAPADEDGGAAAAAAGPCAGPPVKEMEPSKVARVLSCDAQHARVELCGRELQLDLRFEEEEIEPLFSGGCWAGSVIWYASLLLCDVVLDADKRTRRETGVDNCAGIAKVRLEAAGVEGPAEPHYFEHGRGGEFALPVDATAKLPAIRGRRVLELGAGCGLPGLAAHMTGAALTLLTEQPAVTAMLDRTVSTHFVEAAAEGSLAAVALDWNEVKPPAGEGSDDPGESGEGGGGGGGGYDAAWPPRCRRAAGPWDVILVSDCVYEPLY